MSKGGRPTEGDKVKLAPLNMRTSPDLRAQIERAAETTGRSLTQEVERRLVTSFIFDEVRGGPHIGAFANMICSAIQMIELRSGKRWMDDFDTFTQVRGSIDRLLRWNNPGSQRNDELNALQNAATEAEQIADEAEKALLAFRTDNGFINRSGMFGGGQPRRGALSDPRAGWSDDQRGEEATLAERASVLRAEARRARRAFDELFASTVAGIEASEANGEEVADALFADIGPKGK